MYIFFTHNDIAHLLYASVNVTFVTVGKPNMCDLLCCGICFVVIFI